MSLFEDHRWLQRLQNYQRSLSHLDQAIKTIDDRDTEAMSDLEKQGVIKCFEMAFELAWNTLQDYFYEQGYNLEKGPRSAIQQAFKDNLIKDGDVWIAMIKSRND